MNGLGGFMLSKLSKTEKALVCTAFQEDSAYAPQSPGVQKRRGSHCAPVALRRGECPTGLRNA